MYSPMHDPLLSQSRAQHENRDDETPKPPPSPGKARQAKRLQLRNAGFRGAPVPARKVTPEAFPSGSWSTMSVLRGSSDVENVSPAGTRAPTPVTQKRQSSGVLQEIGNSTITHRPRKARQRVSDKTFNMDDDMAPEETLYARLSTSPPAPRSHYRRQSIKTKPKVSHRRRSVSAEMSKYIEHLEGELATAQSQLSSITSSAEARDQTSKMRHLNAETKQLQDELADWEKKYEQRVQEEVDRHLTIETDLRARIRHLEADADDAKFRIQELETQLESTTQSMQAVEGANVSLEKRLEMMSELLASTKVDLHAETPGRARRQARPKSMLPRFPTASSLIGSPERGPRTQPTSPIASFTSYGTRFPVSPRHSIVPFDQSPEQTDFFSEAESIFSEDSATGDSMTSVENFEGHSSHNPWGPPLRQATTTTAKPARRMRRFGAGSFGPKPLILPAASQAEYFPPASAPPLEHRKSASAILPRVSKKTEANNGSPTLSRRRASTTANETTFTTLPSSPFFDIQEQTLLEDSIVSLSPPPSAGSHATTTTTTTRHSSLEFAPVRNLMEELSAARSIDAPASAEQSHDVSAIEDSLVSDDSRECSKIIEGFGALPALESNEDSPEPDATQGILTSTSTAVRPQHRRTHSRKVSIAGRTSDSMFGRLRILFGDLWRSPVLMARYLIQAAQAKMSIPRPLINVQWWLVGVLLGPMAKRRIAHASRCCSGTDKQIAQAKDSPSPQPSDDKSEIGSSPADEIPPDISPSATNAVAVRSKKLAVQRVRCVHHRAKHSPWLWIKFSITLAFAIGAAFKDGPGSLMKATLCRCRRKDVGVNPDGRRAVTS